jgi:hypothetical protein
MHPSPLLTQARVEAIMQSTLLAFATMLPFAACSLVTMTLFNWYMGCCATLLMSQLPFRLLLGTTCVLAYTSGWYEKVFAATNVVLLVFVAAITALWSSMSEAEG